MGVMQDRHRMMGACDSELPPQYKRLTYVHAPYGAYLDTGITINRGCIVTLDMMILATTNNFSYWGYRWSGNWTSPYQFYIQTNKGNRIIIGTTATGANNNAAFVGDVRQKIVMDTTTGSAYVNGSQVSLTTNTTNAFDSDGSSVYHPTLFGANMVGTIGYSSGYMKVYAYQVEESGALTQKLIPCKNASGTVGFWDAVRHTFMTSATAIAFDEA